MAEGAFFIMGAMLLLLALSAAGFLAAVIFATILAAKPTTRALGLRIFLAGGIGILLTDVAVAIARTDPSALDQLAHVPYVVQILVAPLTWAFIMPIPAFAFVASSLFGFAWGGGIAALVAAFVLVRRRLKGAGLP